mmetsp:Transcript_6396/g.11118  ORF Transcript_6396/g.11118 Transcript_6396/m.11118 type:complete len:429 (-) Transcript_6396:174-1460(-)
MTADAVRVKAAEANYRYIHLNDSLKAFGRAKLFNYIAGALDCPQLEDLETRDNILIYLEHYESWNSDTISRLIDYCSELRELKGLNIFFMLELSTDPQLLIHSLGYTTLQKLYMHQLESPAVDDLYASFLLHLLGMKKFPLLMPSVSRQLLRANSFNKFKRLLRSLLIEHFVNDKAAAVLSAYSGFNDILNECGITKAEMRKLQKEAEAFLIVKTNWVNSLNKFGGFIGHCPDLQPIPPESIYADFVIAEVPEKARCYIDLSGALLSQSGYETVVEYLQVLHRNGLMAEADLQKLLSELSNVKGPRKNCRGWISVHVLTYFVKIVREELCSPELILKTRIDPADLCLFVASEVGDLDPDLQIQVVEQLLRPKIPSSVIPIQQLEDISLVSYIILRKPRDLELNSAFSTFVQIKTDQDKVHEAALSEYQ